MTGFHFDRHRASKNFQVEGNLNLKVNRHPVREPENKLTIINSKSEVIMSDEQLKTITNKVNSIRNKIIE